MDSRINQTLGASSAQPAEFHVFSAPKKHIYRPVIVIMKKKSTRNLWIISGIVLLGAAYTLSEYLERKNKESPIVATTLPEIEDNHASGQLLYQSNCLTCHGEALGGKKGLGPPFVHGYYKPSHHGDVAFYRAMELGVTAHHWQFGNMPPVPSLSKEDATEIIKYIRFVQRANGIS